MWQRSPTFQFKKESSGPVHTTETALRLVSQDKSIKIDHVASGKLEIYQALPYCLESLAH